MRQVKQPSIPEIRNTQGFTLAEVVTVTIIIGILAAIAAPSWLTFLNNHRLNTAKSELLQGLRKAQNKATQERTTWQFTVQEKSDTVKWRVDASADGICDQNSGWTSLYSIVTVDNDNTTFDSPKENCWRVRFTDRGRVNGLGRVTLSTGNMSNRRCVIVATFLGAIREDKDEDCEP